MYYDVRDTFIVDRTAEDVCYNTVLCEDGKVVVWQYDYWKHTGRREMYDSCEMDHDDNDVLPGHCECG